MYSICFCANESYMKFAGVMIHNILEKTQIANKILAEGGMISIFFAILSVENLGKNLQNYKKS